MSTVVLVLPGSCVPTGPAGFDVGSDGCGSAKVGIEDAPSVGAGEACPPEVVDTFSNGVVLRDDWGLDVNALGPPFSDVFSLDGLSFGNNGCD